LQDSKHIFETICLSKIPKRSLKVKYKLYYKTYCEPPAFWRNWIQTRHLWVKIVNAFISTDSLWEGVRGAAKSSLYAPSRKL